MRTSRRAVLGGMAAAVAGPALAAPGALPSEPWLTAPGEFEPQDFIWLPWVERGFFGAPPLSSVVLELMKILTPFVRVRLLHSGQLPIERGDPEPPQLGKAESEARVSALLAAGGIDLGRVELIYNELPYGAIQDPGPFFLRSARGGLAIADFRLNHADPRVEALDRAIAAGLGLPTVGSPLVSEGGGRQSNGRGTLLLARSVEQARNPGWSLAAIEQEHSRVHGARKVVWLDKGPADEHWGRLADGRFGLGTGGHVDVFARFADPSTVLLAEVSADQRLAHAILAETHERMEHNYRLLRAATDQDGRPFRIIRMPVPDPLIATVRFEALSMAERTWLRGAVPGHPVEYYLPASYLNFIIANGAVVTCRLHEAGRDSRFGETDRRARLALERSFPGRKIVQIGVTPLLHGGGGLHCHSRNQPSV